VQNFQTILQETYDVSADESVTLPVVKQIIVNKYLSLGKFSFGMGDRFAQQGNAQLSACVLATKLGADIVPVWNKSNREHTPIGTEPSSLRAEAGGDGLALPKEIYSDALDHVDELCAPYATVTVIDIDRKQLPTKETVNGWASGQFVSALRHDPKNKTFNSSFRQLIHVGFKIAAKKGDRYLNALKKHEAVIAKNVTENLFERHMKPLLLGQ
jgi:hypothetical protein